MSRVGNGPGDYPKSSWRWPWPKTFIDRFALSVFTLGGIFLIWYELLFIMPTYYSENSPTVIACWVFLVVMVSQIYCNMFMLITTDTSVTTIQLPSILLTENWKNCKKCKSKAPPRSHHCVICDVCIVKRDHHCWFAGYCIGHKNHRYYLVMLIYMTITAVSCNIFNCEFVLNVKGTLGIFNIMSFFMPHVGYIFYFYEMYTFLITTLSSVGFVFLVVFLWLLQIQIRQIVTGRTQYERNKKIIVNNLGWKKNLIDILGHRWLIVWFVPWIESHLPGNGFTISEKRI